MPEYETVYGEITRRSDAQESYPDRWKRAVDKNVVLDVYVPADVFTTIAPKSGIVGSPVHGSDHICIDYEGNLHGAANMQTWDDRVHHAAGRHVSVYPTVARMHVPAHWLIAVGSYSVRTQRVTVTDAVALQAWLNPASV